MVLPRDAGSLEHGTAEDAAREGVRDMVRVCDGRMSGTAYGMVCCAAPEAAASTSLSARQEIG